jgi:hypothetical protein
MTSGPRICRRPGPVAEQTCCGADPFATATVQGTTTLLGSDRSPPYVCRRDVIEVTHALAAAANRGWLSLREWEARYPAAQLEAEIAQLKDALARREQIGVATGLLAQRFADHHERAWSLPVRLSQNCHCALP